MILCRADTVAVIKSIYDNIERIMGRGGRNRKRKSEGDGADAEGNRSSFTAENRSTRELHNNLREVNLESKKRMRSDSDRESHHSEPIVHVSMWTNDQRYSKDIISINIDNKQSTLPPPFVVSNVTNQIQFTTLHQTKEFDELHTNQIQEIWTSLLQRKNTSKVSLWSKPTLVQSQSWPILLSKKHYSLIQISPTGSGKTLAYGIPAIVRCCSLDNQKKSSLGKSILVLVPTRELVIQVQKQFEMIIRAMTTKIKIKVIPCYGGVAKDDQEDSILNSIGCHVIVVGTPGRVLDIVESKDNARRNSIQGKLFNNLAMIVLDEADRLAINIDLQSQIDKILNLAKIDTNLTQNQLQIILCSATFPRDKAGDVWSKWVNQRPCGLIEIDAISLDTSRTKDDRIKKNDVKSNESHETETTNLLLVDITGKETELDDSDVTFKKERSLDALLVSKIPSTLSQIVHVCSDHKKPRKLIRTIQSIFNETKDKRNVPLGIVFCSTIKTVQFVHKLLKKEQIVWSCAELHSQLKQSVRERTIADFKCGKIPLLIATDIAARGIHVNNIQYVINYDFPTNLEQYIHRCGRAGRKVSMAATTATQQPDINVDNNAGDAKVYSFFSRFLVPLAPDLIRLLESTNQWIDPNLIDLCNGVRQSKQSRRKKSDNTHAKQTKSGADSTQLTFDCESAVKSSEINSDSDDDRSFPELSTKRVVLQRALNLGDPSDESEDDVDTND